MSGVVRGDEKKIELWVHGRNDLYSLEAINIELKLELILKEAKEYTEVVTGSLALIDISRSLKIMIVL